MGRTALAGVAVALALRASAATIVVPRDAPTIQAGVDAARAGDVVLIEPGTYRETVSVRYRSGLVIRGSGADATFVIGPGGGSTIVVRDSDGIELSHLHLSSVLVQGDRYHGGVEVRESTGVEIHHLRIDGHSANAIMLAGATVDIHDNVLTRNGDDGVSFRQIVTTPTTAVIRNNTIAHNRGMLSVGIFIDPPIDRVTIFDNIVFDNEYGIHSRAGSGIDLTRIEHDHNLVDRSRFDYGGGLRRAANEPLCDPGFVDPPSDVHLGPGSCAIDAGVAWYLGHEASPLDMDGTARPEGGAPDIGADEACGGPVPDGVYDALRVHHAGDAVSVRWDAARALLPGEHFHLRKAMDHAAMPFVRVDARCHRDLRHDETDRRSRVQFFDLRVANACEVESAPEYPPSH